MDEQVPLKDKSVLSLEEVSALIGVPLSTLMEILDVVPAPIFLMGRRRKILSADLQHWLIEVKETFPWTQRQNNRRKGR